MKPNKINFATLVFAIGGLILVGYFAAFWFPVTDNALIIEKPTLVVAGISGQIEKLYVEPGQLVKQDDPILMITVESAAINVTDDIVRAPADGYVKNLCCGESMTVASNTQLFSFVDTTNNYLQANFNETDLLGVYTGDKVLIFPRAYLWHKVFHGIIIPDNWLANRGQFISRDIPILSNKNGTQFSVGSDLRENHWFSPPQRFPVLIKILDNDTKYPLRPGMSSYVYIQTK